MLLEAESGFDVVDEAGDLRDAVFKIRRRKPDVLVLDVRLPDGDGVEAIGRLQAEAPECRVLVLSMEDDAHHVETAFANGASGYVLKEAAEEELVTAVHEVAKGGRYLHPDLGARLMQAQVIARREAEADPLSDREHEVLRLLARGHTNQEIAQRLYISVRTAETHRSHIMRKLGLESRAQLVAYAIEHGLLDSTAADG